MQSSQVFIDAVISVLRHWKDVLRIMTLPLAMLVALHWGLLGQFRQTGWGEIALLVANFVFISVVAVSWHRLVLLKEKPFAIAPRLHGKVMFLYFIIWFVLGMVLALIMFFVGAVVLYGVLWFAPAVFEGETARALLKGNYKNLTGGVFAFCVVWGFLFMLFRLGLRLPHVALHKKTIGLDASRVLTKPIRRGLIVVSALAAAGQLGLMLWPLDHTLVDVAAVNLGYAMITLFGAAILTQIYMICIPKTGQS